MLEPPALVVGSAGQVGSAIARALGDGCSIGTSREAGAADVAFDLATAATGGSSLDALRQLDFGAVYCVGGFTDVERCESERERANAVNARGPEALARLARERNVPFVYFSTDYVFDGKGGPYVEDDVPKPICAYGESKLIGERLVLEAHPAALVIRTTVVYGPDARGKNFVYSLVRALREHRTLRVPVDQIGTPTYNPDLAQIAVGLVASGASGIVHVAGPDLLSRYDFAIAIASRLGFTQPAIEGVLTAQLGQVAPRPLRAGLRTEHVRTLLPGIAASGANAAVDDWIARGTMP